MKFHELEEGKKYEAVFQNGTKSEFTFFKEDGLLMVNTNNYTGFSSLRMKQVATMDFTEIPNYVTFEEAIKHMSLNKGANECLFKRSKFIITLGDELQSWDYHGNFTEDRTFTLDMLEPKWIIL